MLLCSITAANAQLNKSLQLGIGFGSTLNYGSGYKIAPAFSLAYDHLLPKTYGPGRIGVGAIVAYRSARNKGADYEGSGYKNKWNNLLTALRGTYHLTSFLPENVDVYGAVQLGARFETITNELDYSGEWRKAKDKNTKVHVGVLAGGRYFFKPALAVFAEVGYDLTIFKLGVAGKF